MKLNTIKEAIEDIKKGKIIIIVDDENRENEGDFVVAAEKCTPEIINFMATYGRGLICTPILKKRCNELNLNLMVNKNTDSLETSFTISIDLIGKGNSTGISTHDRSRTIHALINENTKPEDFAKPGHVFPLQAKTGGVLRRAGHTEASVDISRLAGLYPASVIVEVLNSDGTMARLPNLFEIAKEHNFKIISIEDLIAFRIKNESLIKKIYEKEMKIENKKYKLICYKQLTNNEIHIALTFGEWGIDDVVNVRVQNSINNEKISNSFKLLSSSALHTILHKIKKNKGAFVFLAHKNKNENSLPFENYFKKQKNDPLDYGIGAQILRNLNIRKMNLISNKPQNKSGLIGYGLEVVKYTTF